jgi:hypothetical protein
MRSEFKIQNAKCKMMLPLVAALGLSLAAQQPTLVLLSGVGDYFGETYTTGPVAPAEYVFFEGEPVTMELRIANWGSAIATLVSPLATSREFFTIKVSHDGVPVMPQVVIASAIERETLRGPETVAPAARMAIEPGDAFVWRVAIGRGDLAAGVYRVDVGTGAVEATGQTVREEAPRFIFEVRPRSAVAPAELARREAERLTAAGDFASAKVAVSELERIYPDSVAVHLIRSRIADAEGEAVTYAREIELAREFLRRDRDRLFRQFARPGQIEDLIESLAP